MESTIDTRPAPTVGESCARGIAERLQAEYDCYVACCDGLDPSTLSPLARQVFDQYGADAIGVVDSMEEDIGLQSLSVEVRTDWYCPQEGNSQPTQFRILLACGGPSVCLIGEIGERGFPYATRLEYQDWFTPWQPLSDAASQEALDWQADHFSWHWRSLFPFP